MKVDYQENLCFVHTYIPTHTVHTHVLTHSFIHTHTYTQIRNALNYLRKCTVYQDHPFAVKTSNNSVSTSCRAACMYPHLPIHDGIKYFEFQFEYLKANKGAKGTSFALASRTLQRLQR